MNQLTNVSLSPEFAELLNSKRKIRISDKETLTIWEAAAYTGIGIHKLSKLAEAPHCDYVLYVGTQRLFIRKKLERFLEKQTSI